MKKFILPFISVDSTNSPTDDIRSSLFYIFSKFWKTEMY